MAPGARPRVLFALLLLVLGALAVPSKIVSSTVQVATSSLSGNDLTLAEYELQYDQDLRWLEVTDCPPNTCTVNLTACACDYTSKDPAVCGRTTPGCPACDTSFCTPVPDVVDDWEILPLNTLLRGTIPSVFSFRQYRLFLSPANACKALHIRLSQRSGDTDLYVTNDLTNPPNGGPYLGKDTNVLIGFTPDQFPAAGGYPWFSYRTKGDHLTLCPGERNNIDPAVDNYQPGTYYIQVQTYAFPGDYELYAELFDIAPAWTAADAQANNWPVPVPCSETLAEYSALYPTENITCLPEEQFYTSRDWEGDFPLSTYKFVKQMEGPCPHLYAMSAHDSYGNVNVYGRLNGNANFTRRPGSRVVIEKEGLQVADDWPRAYVIFSVCPLQGNRSTVTFQTRRLANAGSWLRFFFTVNPKRFRATPLPALGPLSEQAFVTLEGIDFKTIDGSVLPDVSDQSGIIFPCTFDGGGQCPNLYVTVTATTNESTPAYPPPMFARKTLFPATIFPPPEFLATENITTRLPNVLRASMLIGFGFNNGRREGKFQACPREAIPRIQLRLPRGRFVNDLFEAPQEATNSTTFVPPNCDRNQYDSLVASINAIEEQLTQQKDLLSASNIQLQIDYLSWRPGYLGCNALTQTLLANYTNSITINERNCLGDQSGADAELDPCCFTSADWNTCCVAKPTTVTTTSYQPYDSPDTLQSQCGDGSECVYTYLEDYSRASNAICSPPLAEKFWKDRYSFWVTCSDLTFGQFLRGRECSIDSDCKTIGNYSAPNAYCDFNDVTAPWTVNVDAPKYGQCVTPYNDLVNAFLDCFIDQGGLLSVLVLTSYGVNGSATTQARRDALKQVTALRSADCTATWNTAIPSTDPSSADGFWTGQTHWIWNIGTAKTICDSARSPKIFHGSPGYLNFFDAPLSCSRFTYQNDAATIQSPLKLLSSQTDCSNIRMCNFGTATQSYGLNSTALAAFCKGPETCAACRPDGTHCEPVPASVIAANGGACPTQVCFNVDGTITLPSNGACPSTCTVPCRDSNYNPIPCLNQTACESAGRCTDEGLFTDFTTGLPGACLQAPSAYHRPSCMVDYSLRRVQMLDTDVGCINRALGDEQTCTSKSGTWMTGARSEAECKAYGCGCVKESVGGTEINMRLSFVDNLPSSDAECAACGSTCKNYFDWVPGRWVPGVLHSAARVNYTLINPFTWSNATFDFTTLSAQLESAILYLYSQQAKSAAQCRFNKVAPSIQAVALACTASPQFDEISNIEDQRPIGIGQPCGGAALSISAPPNVIDFRSDSLAPAGYCPSVRVFNSPADAYGSAASSQQLSTYFTKKRRGAKGRTLEFANAKGALIGQVLSNGIRLDVDTNSTSTFTSSNGARVFNAKNVRVCLNAGIQVATLNKKFDSYPVLDFAEERDGRLVPLRLNITTDATLGLCAEVQTLLDTAYVPVIRLEGEFEKVEPPKLTKGEKTILFLACAAYFITAGYAIYHMAIIIIAATLIPFYLLPPFWMASMLTLANTIRGIYFALIGSETIANSNVADIILFELPTFMWFTATTLVVLLWISIGSARKQKEIGPKFRVLFLVSNGVMYLLFILFVVLFSVLKDKKKVDKICGDRLPVKFDRTQREVLFIVYQCFLAVVALLLSAAFMFGGIKLIKLLRSSKKNPNAPLSADELKLLMLAIVCGLSFAAHAVFVFVLAIVQPGIAYLVVILVVLECLPSAYLLFNLPTRTKQASGTGSTSASGSATG